MTSTLRRSSNDSTMTNGNGVPNGGRSSSQVSIYNYPEHLNPFHEDDNHKRLRFWKMTSNSKNSDRDRSNSFSLNGLKEMWAFKTFRLKKRSSTLGINKTSESPPQLRRQQSPHENGISGTQTPAPFDSRIRHTVNGSSGDLIGPAATQYFERRAGYRSSLQNVHSNNGGSTVTLRPSGAGSSATIGFNRNDRYRSTIQSGYQTTPSSSSYVHHRGSVTPTPMRSQLTHGQSQSSLNSTNPFEDDFDDGPNGTATATDSRYGSTTDMDDNVSRITVDVVPNGAGGVRKVYRKKRRAPPPPPPRTSSVPSTHASISQSETATTSITTLTETSRENSIDDDDTEVVSKPPAIHDISQLAAEIASFVLTADSDRELSLRNVCVDAEMLEQQPITSTTNTVSSNSSTTTSTSTFTTKTTTTTVDVHPNRSPSPPSPPSSPPLRMRHLPASARESPENNAAYPERPSRTPTPSRESSAIDPDKPLNTLERVNPRIFVRAPTADEIADEEYSQQSAVVADPIDYQPLPEIPLSNAKSEPSTSTAATPSAEAPPIRPSAKSKVNSLYITESIEDLAIGDTTDKRQSLRITESTEDVRNGNGTTIACDDKERYRIKFVALKTNAQKPEPSPNKPKWSPAPWTNRISGSTKPTLPAAATSTPVVTNHNDSNNQRVTLRSDSPSAEKVVVPPRRRRSVKDIIESINKCQSLLRINQSNGGDAATQTVDKRVSDLDAIDYRTVHSTNNNPHVTKKPADSIASETQGRHTTNGTQSESNNRHTTDRNNNRGSTTPHRIDSVDVDDIDAVLLQQLPVMVERYAEFSSGFKMCAATTTSAAASSPVVMRRHHTNGDQQQKQQQLRTDWNPLPKPRRSRNLTQEAAAASASDESHE